MPASSSSSSDSDLVLIDQDDISNYNPEQILPQPPEVIATIRTWLQPTSYDAKTGEFRKHLASRASGTGAWILSNPTYQEWLTGDDYGTLWLKGIPGSGKSVLAASLVDELSRSHPGVPVLYFFFRQIIDANHQPTTLLRDWLDQILLYSPPLQKVLRTYAESKKPLDSISMEDLWKHLRSSFSALPDGVYCITDALDEMDHGNDQFLKALAALGQWRPAKVKVILTSRPVPSVEVPLRKARCLQIRLEEDMVDVDISTFVHLGLQGSSVSPQDQEIITKAIPGRANGLFLYAKLAMDAFLEAGADVKEVLGRLPTDLNDMYANLIRDHAARSGVPDAMQRSIFQWATHASRPLRLLELAEVINVTDPTRQGGDLKTTKDLVRAACGPLLEILGDETICVVHHSLTEYLKGTTRADVSVGYPILRRVPTHESLALACLEYLLEAVSLAPRSNMGPPISSLDTIGKKLQHPFFDYAAVHWYRHVRKAEIEDHDQTRINNAIARLFNSPQRMAVWPRLTWQKNQWDVSTPQILIAAYFGLGSYTKMLLNSSGVDADAVDQRGRTALFWAAERGHVGVVRVLLAGGANPDKEETSRGNKPLHAAALANHAGCVTALLEAGVDPLTPKTRGNKSRSVGHTPLMFACESGHLEAVNAILPFLPDVAYVHRALCWAARYGHAKVVARILDYPNVDVNEKVQGDTPLFLACASCDPDTIAILLEAGADPNILCTESGPEIPDTKPIPNTFGENPAPDRGFSALQTLCRVGNKRHLKAWTEDDRVKAVRLLVQAGANIHHRTRYGMTALHTALSSPILVRLLLDAGADANTATDCGATPLHSATSIDSMILLIEHGNADLNKKNEDGLTPLLYLLDNRRANDMIGKFLQYGPDCTVTDEKGNTAIHIALRQYYTESSIIQALIDGGANPHLRNSDGVAPFHLMICPGSKCAEIIDILLKAGSDINEKDRHGFTMLFRSVAHETSRYEQIPHGDIQMLIDRGALLDVRDLKGRTVLHEAVATAADGLFQQTADGIFLESTTETRFEYLVRLGVDVRATDYGGNNLLHELALRGVSHGPGILRLWKRLVSLGLDIGKANNQGRTPLHILCSKLLLFERRHVWDSLDFVISETTASSGGSIDAADLGGLTPLHLAAVTSEYCVKRLCDAGANAAAKTAEGLTPLHLAARARRSNIVGLLLDTLCSQAEYGTSRIITIDSDLSLRGTWYREAEPKVLATLDAQDQNGWTALSHACRSGRPETVELLLNAGSDASIGSPLLACAQFESEQQLWGRRRHPADVEANCDATGLRLADNDRPERADQDYHPAWRLCMSHLDSNVDTARLEEILELLMKNQATTPVAPSIVLSDYQRAIKDAFDSGSTYAVTCLTAADLAGYQDVDLSKSWPSHLAKHLSQSSVDALRGFSGAKSRRLDPHLLWSLLIRRDYHLIEELFHSGADFLELDLSVPRVTALGMLVQHGFARLVKKIGRLILSSSNGGTSSAPSQVLRHPTNDAANENPLPLLLLALGRSLPNMEMVRLLVEEFHADIDERHDRNECINLSFVVSSMQSALHIIAKGEFWWHAALALPYLLEKGADMNVVDGQGHTPLHLALGWEHHRPGLYGRDVACALIKAGTDVNATDEFGVSYLAYTLDDLKLLQMLLDRGARPSPDILIAAIDARRVDVLVALLSAGADPNVPLHSHDGRKLQIGLESRSRRDKPIRDRYALYYAATTPRVRFFVCPELAAGKNQEQAGCVQTILALLRHGADPFATFLRRIPTSGDILEVDDEGGSEQTGEEITKGYEQCTVVHQLLIDGGTVEPIFTLTSLDVDRRDAKGRTLLHAACLAEGYGPDAPFNSPHGSSNDDSTEASPTLLRHILSRGADPLATDHGGSNAIHLMLSDHPKSEEPNRPFRISLAYMARTYPQLVNQKQHSLGRTPLHLALECVLSSKEANIVEQLLAAGADPLARDDNGDTALHILGRRLDTAELRDLFKLLVDRGCDINARNHRGETPLFGFYEPYDIGGCLDRAYRFVGNVKEADAAAFTLLSTLGADFHARDHAGRGLLHVVASSTATVVGHGPHRPTKRDLLRFKELVRDKGLDPMMEDNRRQTAVDVAVACRNEAVLGLFEKKKKRRDRHDTSSGGGGGGGGGGGNRTAGDAQESAFAKNADDADDGGYFASPRGCVWIGGRTHWDTLLV
ncbi:ankyrin repeat-containing domain protein [Xylariomycetidae sp. FL2044]|nr:ankyrin repeat-containing domain protein [Xylariomycetidae sp. FL2044]